MDHISSYLDHQNYIEKLTPSPFITPKELGKYLRLSDSTIYKLASKGIIPGYKIGNSWRFVMEEVNEVIRNSGGMNSNRSL